jgi:hypothetical protein
MQAPFHVEGVVLCHVGEHRLALLARDGTQIDDALPQALYAGRAFSTRARAPGVARMVTSADRALVVDTLEIHGEPLALMPVPRALTALMGGALRGFVDCAGFLWPVVSLSAFASSLEAP